VSRKCKYRNGYAALMRGMAKPLAIAGASRANAATISPALSARFWKSYEALSHMLANLLRGIAQVLSSGWSRAFGSRIAGHSHQAAHAGKKSSRHSKPASRRPSPKLSQITFDEAIEEYAAWLPGGNEILFSRERAGLRKIFRKNVVTDEEAQLTKGECDEIQATCSPDGRTMLFVRARESHVKLEPGDVFGVFLDGDIWALDLASGKEKKLIENAFNPDYSHDGKRIAFDASWVGPRRIWVVDSQGHNPQQLTSDSSEAVTHVRPRWSPDGTKIVFQNIEHQSRLVAVGTVRVFLVLSRRRNQHLAGARQC
jgi:hypothetical protein